MITASSGASGAVIGCPSIVPTAVADRCQPRVMSKWIQVGAEGAT
jgi:hypothetical protein